MNRGLLLGFCSLSLALVNYPVTEEHLTNLLARFDPHSLPQHLALYALYPQTPQGQKALQRAARLLHIDQHQHEASLAIALPQLSLLVDRFIKPDAPLTSPLTPEQIALIDKLAAELPHRKLKGHQVTSIAELQALDPLEIDMARGLLLTFLGEESDKKLIIVSYEALLDLLALQVLARIEITSSAQEKIAALNHLLFFELGIRFPPHSRYVQEIDSFTFLPSVLDKRRGVCLGVSSLYLCLAQRLALNLESITPPGHIYVRYVEGSETINIETTSRGIHLPSNDYLSVQTRSLQNRNPKEVIGLTFMNQGATLWQIGRIQEAVHAYRKAQQFLSDDLTVQECLGYTLLLNGQPQEGYALLKEIKGCCSRCGVGPSSAVEDLLNHKTDLEGISALFLSVDENRESILNKHQRLQEVLNRYPEFRAGWFSLAVSFLQLNREGEAMEALLHYHKLDPTDPVVEYYLATLAYERHDYPLAWHHLNIAQNLAQQIGYAPQALTQLHRTLKKVSPLPKCSDRMEY